MLNVQRLLVGFRDLQEGGSVIETQQLEHWQLGVLVYDSLDVAIPALRLPLEQALLDGCLLEAVEDREEPRPVFVLAHKIILLFDCNLTNTSMNRRYFGLGF